MEKVKREQLSESEKKKLKAHLRSRIIFSFLLFVSMALVIYLVAEYSVKITQTQLILLAFISGFAVLLIAYLFTRNIIIDLQYGYKYLYESTLDEKRSWETDEPGISGKPDNPMNPLVSSYMIYMFYSKGMEYRVKKEVYEKVELGEIFIVPTTPKYRQTFDIRAKAD